MMTDSSSSESFAGPTPDSNWVIHGKLIAGAYPGGKSQDEAYQKKAVSDIIDAGATAFASLITEKEMTKYKLRPYQSFASQYAAQQNKPEPEFLSFPIPDGFIAMDDDVMGFVMKLVDMVKLGSHCVYLHCRHGHGRAGTIVALLQARYYSVGPQIALDMTARCHSQRVNCHGKSPRTRAQVLQIQRLIPPVFSTRSSHSGQQEEGQCQDH